MTYLVELDPPAQATLDALPHSAAVALAEALVLLEIAPYSGDPINPERTPEGPLRNLPFTGGGMITYLIVEPAQRVDVLTITWVG
jgi:hypothetical protein